MQSPHSSTAAQALSTCSFSSSSLQWDTDPATQSGSTSLPIHITENSFVQHPPSSSTNIIKQKLPTRTHAEIIAFNKAECERVQCDYPLHGGGDSARLIPYLLGMLFIVSSLALVGLAIFNQVKGHTGFALLYGFGALITLGIGFIFIRASRN